MIALSGSQFVADCCQEAVLHRQGGLGPDPGGRIVLGEVSQFSGPSLQQMLGVLEIRDVLLKSRLRVPQRPLLPCDDRHEHKPDQRRQDHGCRVDRNISHQSARASLRESRTSMRIGKPATVRRSAISPGDDTSPRLARRSSVAAALAAPASCSSTV